MHLLLLIITVLPVLILSMLLFSQYGELLGLGAGLLLYLGLAMLGSRLLMAITWAKKPHGFNHLDLVVKNLKCRTGLGEVEIYISDALAEKIFVLDPLVGTKSIVLGSYALKRLEGAELQAILHHLFVELRQKKWRLKTHIVTLFLPYTLAIKLARQVFSSPYPVNLTKFLLAPAFMLRQLFLDISPRPVQAPLKEASYLYDLQAAYSKLRLFEESGKNEFINELIGPIEVATNRKMNLFGAFIEKKSELQFD